MHCLCDSVAWPIVLEAIERFGRIIVGSGTQVTPEPEYVFVTFRPLLKELRGVTVTGENHTGRDR